MTTRRRRIVADRRRRRADGRPMSGHPASVNGGREFAEAVFGRPPSVDPGADASPLGESTDRNGGQIIEHHRHTHGTPPEAERVAHDGNVSGRQPMPEPDGW
jgi:hypothetical protein